MTLLVILLVVAIAWGGLAHLIFPERFTLIEGVVQHVEWFLKFPTWYLFWLIGYLASVFIFTPKLQEKFEEPHLHKTVLVSVVCSVFWPITLPIYGLYKVYRKYRPSK